MATISETWSCKEVRSVIRFLWVTHVSPIEIHRQLIEVYGNGIMGAQHVRKWFRVRKWSNEHP
jgi:hypothetical protein